MAPILCGVVGKTLASGSPPSPRVRIYLAGGIAIAGPVGSAVGERDLPGRQARRLFVRLAALHEPVAHADLADDLWGATWPASWDVAVRALVSKLRRTLRGVGLAGAITNTDRTYALQLPPGTWLDLDAAADAIHRAEIALAAGDLREAAGWALAARAIGTRAVLPGEEGDWLDGIRRRLGEIRLRALECLAETWIEHGDPALAARDAAEAIDVDPYRESAHRLLIRAHLAAGDRGAAASALADCRRVLRDELGVEPAAATVALLHPGRADRADGAV